MTLLYRVTPPLFVSQQAPAYTGPAPLLWLDASDASTVSFSGNDLQWQDKASGLVFSSWLSPNKPTLSAAGNRLRRVSVDFGRDQRCYVYNSTGVNIPAGNLFSVFAVMYWPTQTRDANALGIAPSDAVNQLSNGSASPYTMVYSADRTRSGQAMTLWTGNYTYSFYEFPQESGFIFETHSTTGAPAGIQNFHNGRQLATGSVGSSVAGAFGLRCIGSPDSFYLANGNFGEVLVFSGAMTIAQRAAVREYLSAKWGIPMTPP